MPRSHCGGHFRLPFFVCGDAFSPHHQQYSHPYWSIANHSSMLRVNHIQETASVCCINVHIPLLQPNTEIRHPTQELRIQGHRRRPSSNAHYDTAVSHRAYCLSEIRPGRRSWQHQREQSCSWKRSASAQHTPPESSQSYDPRNHMPLRT